MGRVLGDSVLILVVGVVERSVLGETLARTSPFFLSVRIRPTPQLEGSGNYTYAGFVFRRNLLQVYCAA